MARDGESKKPGAMIYFTIRRGIRHLSQEQKGDLLDAILDYADPDNGKEPDFSADPILDTAWQFVIPALDKDDERYVKKSVGRKYSAYCGACDRNGIQPMSRDDWEAEGCLTYRELKQQGKLQMRALRANARICEQCEPDTDTDAESIPFPYTTSSSRTLSESESESPAPPEAAAPPLNPQNDEVSGKRWKDMTPNEALKNMPPTVKDACIEWMDYKAELGKRMAKKTRERYMEDFESYVAGYGIVAVQALINEAIRNGWNNLYWERLERNPNQYDPQRFPAPQKQSGKSNPESTMDDLRTLQQMFQEDGS